MIKRDKSIDIAKAIGMILVVFGHTQSSYIQVIYQFHLPLFFFLSGMVFDENKLENPKKFFLGKIKGLYWPFVKFELMFLLLHNMLSSIGLYTEMSNVEIKFTISEIAKKVILIITMGYGEQLAGPLWFLISSFEIVLIFGVVVLCLRKLDISPEKQKKYLILFGLISYFIGCFTHFPRMGSQSLIGLLFFTCGYIYKDIRENIKNHWILTMFSGLIVLACFKINYVDISKLMITNKALLILSGLAGTYFALSIANLISHRGNRILEYCGRNTIYILVFHCISFKIVLATECLLYGLDRSYLGCFPTYEVNQLWCVMFVIAGVGIPLLMKKLIDKISNVLRKLIYERKIG